MPETIVVRDEEQLRVVLERIEEMLAEPRDLLNLIGARLQSDSQKAFRDQRLGDFLWPERYPSQEEPFVNIAAVVNEGNRGFSKPTSKVFDRRPALKFSGDLSQSVAFAIVGQDTVEVGTTKEYGSVHQWGGTSSQPVKPSAKKMIAQFLGEEPDGKGGWRKKKRLGSRQQEQREKYWFKLFPLLSSDVLETKVNQRPFVGITDDTERWIIKKIEKYSKAEAQKGGPGGES